MKIVTFAGRVLPVLATLAVAAGCSGGGPPESMATMSSPEFGYLVDDQGAVLTLSGEIRAVREPGDEQILKESGGDPIRHMAMDADRIYWFEGGITSWTDSDLDGDLVAIPRGGGLKETVVSGNSGYQLVSDGEDLYWTNWGAWPASRERPAGLWRLRKGSSKPELVLAHPNLPGVGIDGEELVWCENGDGGGGATCWAVHRDGGEPRVYAELDDDLVGLGFGAVAGGWLYFARQSSPDVPFDQVWALPPGAVEPVLVFEEETDQIEDDLAANAIRDISAARDGRVYAATGKEIREITGGEAGDVIVSDWIDAPLQFDADHVYWPMNTSLLRASR